MRLLHRASLIAAFGAASVFLAPNLASAQLSNGTLNVNVNGADNGLSGVFGTANNGAIFNVEFSGQEFYRKGTFVSDYGFQIAMDVSTFQIADNETGQNPFSPTITLAPNLVTVSGTYANAVSNFSFVRQYSLVTGINALRITTTVTNTGGALSTLRFFEQYDPDQINSDTFADTSGGTVIATDSTNGGDGFSVAGSTANASGSIATFLNETEFFVETGEQLNGFYDGPLQLDPENGVVDTSFLFAFEGEFQPGGTATYTTYQGFGINAVEAQTALAAATGAAPPPPVVVAAPEPGTVGLLALGALPFLGGVARRRINR